MFSYEQSERRRKICSSLEKQEVRPEHDVNRVGRTADAEMEIPSEEEEGEEQTQEGMEQWNANANYARPPLPSSNSMCAAFHVNKV